MFDLDWVRQRLPGRQVEWFATLDSTMTEAARLARAGCASGTVVVVDQQTAGMGRQGHSWHSEAGAGLYVSMVLRVPPNPLLMLAIGLAAQKAIGMGSDLRWPNDVLLGGRKCAGVLANSEAGAVIAGIGINVAHAGFPAELAKMATSLRLHGSSVTREQLLVDLVQQVEAFAALDAESIRTRFLESSSYAQGLRVRVEGEGRTIEGLTQGLNPAGFLIVREDNGKDTTILAGGVRPA